MRRCLLFKKREKISCSKKADFADVNKEYYVLLAIRELAVNLLEVAIVSPERSASLISEQLGQAFFDEALGAAFYEEIIRANKIKDVEQLWQQIRRLRNEAIATTLTIISKKHQKYLGVLVDRLRHFAQENEDSNHELAELLMGQLCAPEFFLFVLQTVHNNHHAQTLNTPLFHTLHFVSEKFLSSVMQRIQQTNTETTTSLRSATSSLSILPTINEEAPPQQLKKSFSRLLKRKYPSIDPTLRKLISHTLLHFSKKIMANT